MKKLLLLLCMWGCLSAEGPRILAVIAHPDDETIFAATLYAITHQLGGDVDVAIITDGAAGYRYSLLAEPIYGKELTPEEMPAIRRQEALKAGSILGIRNYFFLSEVDTGYTLDPSVPMGEWEVDQIRLQLVRLFPCYDFIFTMLPVKATHGHHQAATQLALEAAHCLSHPPTILAANFSEEGEPIAIFDRSRKFGFRDRLSYQIVVDWFIAEHKSQGTLQGIKGEKEYFYLLEGNRKKTIALFDELAAVTPSSGRCLSVPSARAQALPLPQGAPL